jgi:hypothetical protein
LEEAAKEGTKEDPSKEMDKGKSSLAFSAENPVTLRGIADRNEITKDQLVPLAITKHPRVPGKSGKKKAMFG